MKTKTHYKPVHITRAYKDIVQQIEDAVADGRLVPGDRLPGERELADQFGVSRTVVREAMRYLEAQGVVKVRHGSGTFVQEDAGPTLSQSLTLLLRLEEASLLELYAIREALELLAAPTAAERATSEDIDALGECIDAMTVMLDGGIKSVEDYRAFNIEDMNFHTVVAEASGNLPLATLLSAILDLTMKGRLEMATRGGFERFLQRTGDRRRSHQEHIGILEALANRDGAEAKRLTHEHLQRSLETFRGLG